ncbi:MAG: LSU ribosomal protein L6p (L9e) [uncultured Thiotrichaceae bacterium]|uniref:Large ribosomal subunit protein uL6 n=1 Tax=uncultured Thiotrichaceae bacterium TaxID=298394 RepID=A0A6S6RWP5_9GAMM|nr:MAG: LSU ribosomal protein L6p (L9e) [uncultured Thiotrichaceae bacterium]
MSKVARKPVAIPSGVECKLDGQALSLKGSKGSFEYVIHDFVEITEQDNALAFKAKNDDREGWAMAGTMRALTANMVTGVSDGFEKKLQLVGVGYRAKAQGTSLNLTLGFSHPVDHQMPEGISVETPSQTEIIIRGSDKQQVGQVAAEIRAYRPPEPYKGKGVRYVDERIIRKEAKKK